MRCYACRDDKPETEFYRNKTARTGRQRVCRSCFLASVRSNFYRRTYGISVAEYDAMLAHQKGVCFFCGGVDSSGRRLAVDHDHVTGRVRGLLCTKCNHAVARFDGVELVQKLIDYLNCDLGALR